MAVKQHKLNYKRINFNTSEAVDKMFREQAIATGMTMSEYFKYLVVAKEGSSKMLKTFEKQLLAIPQIGAMLKNKEE